MRSLFGFRSSRLYQARGITELYFVIRFESRFRGAHHVLRLGSRFMTRSSYHTLQERCTPLVRAMSFDDQTEILDALEYPTHQPRALTTSGCPLSRPAPPWPYICCNEYRDNA